MTHTLALTPIPHWYSVPPQISPLGSAYKLVCYYASWSQYREGNGSCFPDTIHHSPCTHIIYSFANISNNQIGTWEWNDVSLYGMLNALKTRLGSKWTRIGEEGQRAGVVQKNHCPRTLLGKIAKGPWLQWEDILGGWWAVWGW